MQSNRKKDKSIEIRRKVEFHGGIGATLVMRVFSKKDLARKLRGAGFSAVDFQAESIAPFGIQLNGNWSSPLVARKDNYALPPPQSNGELEAEIARLREEKTAVEHRAVTLESQLGMVAESRWVRLGRRFGVGPKIDYTKS